MFGLTAPETIIIMFTAVVTLRASARAFGHKDDPVDEAWSA
jgi:hypothetical protein